MSKQHPVYAEIDRNRLDDELVLHPKLMEELQEPLPELRAKVKRLEHQKEIEESKAYNFVKNRLIEEKAKYTEATLWSAVAMTPQIQKIKTELIEAQKERDTAEERSRAFIGRQQAVKALVSLWGAQYFSLRK